MNILYMNFTNTAEPRVTMFALQPDPETLGIARGFNAVANIKEVEGVVVMWSFNLI